MWNTFIVEKRFAEIKKSNRHQIQTNCTDTEEDNIEEITRFADKESAWKYIIDNHLVPTCDDYSSYFLVTETIIECCETDEDGEFVSGSDYDMPYDFEWNEDDHRIEITLN